MSKTAREIELEFRNRLRLYSNEGKRGQAD